MEMFRKQEGLIALISVLVITAFIVTVSLAAALMNADEILASYSSLERTRSSGGENACFDNIVGRLRNNSSLTGNVNIELGNTTCSSTVSGITNIRTITSSATVTDAFTKTVIFRSTINVNINTNPFTIERYKDILR